MSPSSDIIKSREETISTFSKSISNTTQGFSDVMALCRLAFMLPETNSSLRDGIMEKMRAAFTTSDSPLPTRGNDLEMRVLAGGVLEQLLGGTDNIADVAALAVVCAPHIAEASEGCGRMFDDLGGSAKSHLVWQSGQRRKLAPTSDLKVEPTHTAVAEALKKLKPDEAVADATYMTKIHTQMVNIVNAMAKLTTNVDLVVNTAQKNAVKNQTILQEETDILWWLFGERSRDLKEPFENIGASSICLIAAKELADLTKMLPEHQTAAQFLSVALSKAGADPASGDVPLSEVVSSTPRHWREEWKGVLKEVMVPPTVASLCPVIKAVELSLGTDGGEWVGFWKKATGLPGDFALQPLSLSLQLYRECLLLRACR